MSSTVRHTVYIRFSAEVAARIPGPCACGKPHDHRPLGAIAIESFETLPGDDAGPRFAVFASNESGVEVTEFDGRFWRKGEEITETDARALGPIPSDIAFASCFAHREGEPQERPSAPGP